MREEEEVPEEIEPLVLIAERKRASVDSPNIGSSFRGSLRRFLPSSSLGGVKREGEEGEGEGDEEEEEGDEG